MPKTFQLGTSTSVARTALQTHLRYFNALTRGRRLAKYDTTRIQVSMLTASTLCRQLRLPVLLMLDQLYNMSPTILL